MSRQPVIISDRVWQLVAESKIQTAVDKGEFDNLPGFGKPLETEPLIYDENWWLRSKIKRDQLLQQNR